MSENNKKMVSLKKAHFQSFVATKATEKIMKRIKTSFLILFQSTLL